MAHFSDLDAGLAGASYSGPIQAAPRAGGPYELFLKRTLDLFIVVLAAPFVLLVLFGLGLMIRRDGGAILYCQERIGRGGRTFRLWKLRSMVVDADEKLEAYLHLNPAACAEWDEHQKLKHDPRVTAFGRFMRKHSIDELPQLVNVLRGDMSVVGPRPPIAAEVACYEGWQRRRLCVRPGLTCVWQVSGRNEISFHEWMLLDMRYIDHWSLAADFGLIWRTVPVVLSGRGAS